MQAVAASEQEHHKAKKKKKHTGPFQDHHLFQEEKSMKS